MNNFVIIDFYYQTELSSGKYKPMLSKVLSGLMITISEGSTGAI